MKNILLIGASGFVGTALLKEALNRNIKVTAIVRNAGKIAIQHPNLEVVEGTITSAEQVATWSKGKDAVISAYNPGWSNPNIYEETLTIYPLILAGVKQVGVERLLLVGGAGTLFVKPGLRVVDSGAIPEAIMPGVKSLGEFYLDTLVNEKNIDWIFFSPAAHLEPGQRTGVYRLGKDDLLVDQQGESKISVEDYAKAMLDEFETPQHHQERFTIAY